METLKQRTPGWAIYIGSFVAMLACATSAILYVGNTTEKESVRVTKEIMTQLSSDREILELRIETLEERRNAAVANVYALIGKDISYIAMSIESIRGEYLPRLIKLDTVMTELVTRVKVIDVKLVELQGLVTQEKRVD